MTYEQAKDQIAKEARLAAQKIYGGSQHSCAREQFEAFEAGYIAANVNADSVARDAWDRACKAQFDSLQSQFLIPDVFKDNDYRKPEYQPK